MNGIKYKIMIILSIINFFVAGFLGYLIGRWSDYYLNFWIKDPNWTPHHWIYGLLLMIIGLYFLKNYFGIWIFSFGIGHFISDLKDFLYFRFIGSDNKTKEDRRFWHID